MKKIISIPLLVFFLNSFGQSYLTLIGGSYVEASGGNVKRINKPMLVTYSRYYCGFYIEGRSFITFPVQGFEKTLQAGGATDESFISGVTETTPLGQYAINIDRAKDGTSVTINLPSYGVAYIITKAQVYSIDGKVNGTPYIKNWKELERKAQVQDSLQNVNAAGRIKKENQQRIDDSLYSIKMDSIKYAAMVTQHEIHYQSGDNFNPIQIKWLLDTIAAKVKMAPNEYLYSEFRIIIDENGYISKAIPNNNQGAVREKYLSMIDSAIAGIKVEAFNVNGKNYASYSILYISLSPDLNSSEKPKKKKLFNF